MKRYVAWVFGAGLIFVGLAAPASAQVSVDVGILAPHVGARVVIGRPAVVYVPSRHREPIYARYDDRWDQGRGRGRGRGWDRRDREYYKDVRDARRDYEKDLREARRDYERNLEKPDATVGDDVDERTSTPPRLTLWRTAVALAEVLSLRATPVTVRFLEPRASHWRRS